jgi:hypothetical protein
MLESLDTVDWRGIAHPPNSTPAQIKEALRSLLTISSERDAEHGYHRLLYALGNDHAGTYFPVAVCVIPALGELLMHNNPFTRMAALNVLVDLTTSFEPEPGLEMFSWNGEYQSVADVLRDAVTTIRTSIESVANSAALTEERALALQLLSQQPG